jgi:hypothetical protein
MGHISFWLMLMMLIYPEITDILTDASKEVGLEVKVSVSSSECKEKS